MYPGHAGIPETINQVMSSHKYLDMASNQSAVDLSVPSSHKYLDMASNQYAVDLLAASSHKYLGMVSDQSAVELLTVSFLQASPRGPWP